jgi:hypothetical protein
MSISFSTIHQQAATLVHLIQRIGALISDLPPRGSQVPARPSEQLENYFSRRRVDQLHRYLGQFEEAWTNYIHLALEEKDHVKDALLAFAAVAWSIPDWAGCAACSATEWAFSFASCVAQAIDEAEPAPEGGRSFRDVIRNLQNPRMIVWPSAGEFQKITVTIESEYARITPDRLADLNAAHKPGLDGRTNSLPVGLRFFDREAEKLWVETHVPKLVRAIRRSALVEGEGQVERSPLPAGLKIAGGETSFGMLFLAPLPLDLELGMTSESREISRIVSGLDSVFRKCARVTRLSYLFNELLNSPISQVVSSNDNWLVSRRRILDASLLNELVEAARDYGKSEENAPDPWATGERVVLRGREDSPIILGKEKRKLTAPQHMVVTVLLEARDEGLTKDELVEKSQHEDARGILKRLARDPDWNKVIHFAGITGGRYRIR